MTAVAAPGAATARIVARLDELAALTGARIDRPGYSAAEDAAHELAAGWFGEAGLTVIRDRFGNLFGERPGEGAAPVWCGSHLDTVPDGGRFDGALGVLCALEAVYALGPTHEPVAVVAFRDEEGAAGGPGLRGSTDRAAADDLPRPAAFVELHIEQGPRLAAAGHPVGVVEGVVARGRLDLLVTGAAAHAGTQPIDVRQDASVVAARITLAVQAAARAAPGAVGAVGRMVVGPGAPNVVPGSADLGIDLRAPSDDACAALFASVLAAAEDAAATERCRVTVVSRHVEPAVAFGPRSLRAVRRACDPDAPALVSGAGHDAAALAAAGVDAAMLFVRSGAGGISHHPDEITDSAAIAAGTAALTHALAELAGRRDPPDPGGA